MKNKYEVRGDTTAVIVESRTFGRQEVLISTSEFDIVNSLSASWSLIRTDMGGFYSIGYTRLNGKQKYLVMHRMIMNAPQGMHVDHINHNTLDNTNDNLRVVTPSQNMQNRIGSKKSKSGVLGVHWNGQRSNWRVRFVVDGTVIDMGVFVDKEEATLVAREARRKYSPYWNEGAV